MGYKYLVAIGASAGGVDALTDFFDNTMPDGVSYVLTTHLHPDHRSFLAEIMQRHSQLEVFEVEDGIKIESNKVYVMPENYVMSIQADRLLLTKRDLSIKINMAIDIFFNSLAKDTLFQKIAIILSGMGEDGMIGIKAISEKGGYVIAQTPNSSGQDSMPLSTINSGYANLVLDPKQMPQAIIDYVLHHGEQKSLEE